MNCILTLTASCVLLSGEAQNYSPRLAQSDCLERSLCQMYKLQTVPDDASEKQWRFESKTMH